MAASLSSTWSSEPDRPLNEYENWPSASAVAASVYPASYSVCSGSSSVYALKSPTSATASASPWTVGTQSRSAVACRTRDSFEAP